MRRDEDIFKKLNKQKPLVKSKEIQPLSSQDFIPRRRNSMEIPIEKPAEKPAERTKPQTRPAQLDMGSFDDDNSTNKRQAARPNSYNTKEEPKAQKKRVKAEPELYYGEEDPDEKPKVSSKLNVFTENANNRPIQRVSSEPVREQNEEIDLNAKEEKKGVQFRHELKYYINYRDYIILRGMLKALIRTDSFADENGGYFVRSLYFDDIYESSLVEKIAGNDTRSKYRIRAYNYKDDNIRFEKKFKYGQYIAKTSIKLSPQEYYSIMDGDFDFLKDRKEDLASELFLKMKNDMLRPRVIVDYDREAYVFPIEECRITFDKDLRAGLLVKDIFDRNAPVMPMFDSGLMVLEVKFFKYLPEFIKRIINNINAADRSAISKYVICRKYE